MLKLTVDQLLEGISALTLEEKRDLENRLLDVLKPIDSSSNAKAGQFMTNALGKVNLTGSDSTFNYQPSQIGGDNQSSTNFARGASGQQELLDALLILKSAIQATESLPELSKIGAEVQTDQLATEAQKESPDKNLIGRTISALKQGLKGITDLAEPVATVASLAAKAWGIPV